ncbi:MAG: hypothetical protein WCA12_02810, partial [Burkholderiales bacterium]
MTYRGDHLWVLSCPKRLRYFLSRDAEALNAVLHIFLRAIEARLRERSRSSAGRIGAVSFVRTPLRRGAER